jgi:plasmid stability protein
MASLQIDNIPQELMERLEVAAKARQHEMSAEAIDRLSQSFGLPQPGGPRTHAELSALAKELRGEGEGKWLTPEFIRMAREYGRE